MNWRMWKEPTASKVRGLLLLVAGLITMGTGFGAWRSPHLDWQGFKQAFIQLWVGTMDEMSRMVREPFSIIGLIVMIVGIWVAMNGLKIVLGTNLPPEE